MKKRPIDIELNIHTDNEKNIHTYNAHTHRNGDGQKSSSLRYKDNKIREPCIKQFNSFFYDLRFSNTDIFVRDDDKKNTVNCY